MRRGDGDDDGPAPPPIEPFFRSVVSRAADRNRKRSNYTVSPIFLLPRMPRCSCFPDTPCGEAAGPTPKPTPRPVTEEERGYYCGFDWAWVVDNCAR